MTRDELEERMERARSTILLLKDLETHEGWKLFAFYGSTAIRLLRTEFVTTPILSMDKAVAAANSQGQLAGWQTAISYPRIVREEAEQELEQLKQELSIHVEIENEQQEQANG